MMNCTQTQELLSAYFDGELTHDDRRQVAHHLRECSACAQKLVGFQELSTMANELPTPVPPKNGWNRLDKLLDGESSTRRPLSKQQPWSLSKPRLLALAASILVVIGAGWLGYRWRSPEAMHTAMLGHYIEEFQRDPAAAQQLLLATYPGQALAADKVIQRVGYRPVVADGLPDGYTIDSTFVMDMPCCTCVQTLCRRRDGSVLVVFEHNDENADWFGKRPSSTANCGGKECCLTEMDHQIAATWKHGKRHLTLIGAKDVHEVDKIVSWLDKQQRANAS